METHTTSFDGWVGRDVVDRVGDKVGKVESIYNDEQTGRPEWVAVRTGLFGHKVTFAPIAGSQQHGDDLQLAYDKDTIKDAPNCEADGHLSEDEERHLFTHYQLQWDNPTTGYGDQNRAADAGFDARRDDRTEAGSEASQGDDAMTRSEEELRVGTERRATGRVRLRKYIVTEQRQITVPVTREEVRLEREPISDADVDVDEAMSGSDIAGTEHEVITHEEVPVVTMETVPKERVRLHKETVTDQETISRAVRKEKIDVDRSLDTGGDQPAAGASGDRQAAGRSAAAPRDRPDTAGGVDANATKAQLMDVARQLDVSGRSRMNKDELVEAIARANRNRSA